MNEINEEDMLDRKIRAIKNREKVFNSAIKPIDGKKSDLEEAFGKEKFERMLGEAKSFFTDKEKEARKNGTSIFKKAGD